MAFRQKCMSNTSNHRAKTYFGMQFITATISTTLVLVLLGLVVFSWFMAHELSGYVRENVNLTLVLKDGTDGGQTSRLKQQLEALPQIKEAIFISSEEALKEQSEVLGTDPTEFIGFNPFAPSFELKLNASYVHSDSIAALEDQLKELPVVTEVEYQKALIDDINHNIGVIGLVLLGLALILLIISFALINNTIRLMIYAKRFLIHTMKLVGASRSFIRRPFLIRSFWQGLLAGLLAIAVLSALAYWVVTYEPDMIQIITPRVMLYVVVTVLVLGVAITMLCTYFSINKFLKMNENALYYI